MGKNDTIDLYFIFRALQAKAGKSISIKDVVDDALRAKAYFSGVIHEEEIDFSKIKHSQKRYEKKRVGYLVKILLSLLKDCKYVKIDKKRRRVEVSEKIKRLGTRFNDCIKFYRECSDIISF